MGRVTHPLPGYEDIVGPLGNRDRMVEEGRYGNSQAQPQQGDPRNMFPPIGLGSQQGTGQSQSEEDGPTNPSFPTGLGPQLAVRRTEEIYQSPATAATPAPNTGNPAALMQEHEEDSALQPDPKTPWGQQAQAQRAALKPTDEDEAKGTLKALIASVAGLRLKDRDDMFAFIKEMNATLDQVFSHQRNPPAKIPASPGLSGSSGVYHKGYRGGDYYPDQGTFLPTTHPRESDHPHEHSPDAVKCSICGNLQK